MARYSFVIPGTQSEWNQKSHIWQWTLALLIVTSLLHFPHGYFAFLVCEASVAVSAGAAPIDADAAPAATGVVLAVASSSFNVVFRSRRFLTILFAGFVGRSFCCRTARRTIGAYRVSYREASVYGLFVVVSHITAFINNVCEFAFKVTGKTFGSTVAASGASRATVIQICKGLIETARNQRGGSPAALVGRLKQAK